MIARHALHTIGLRAAPGTTVRQRIAAIREQLDRLQVRMPLSAERTFAMIYRDGLAASEGLLMQAWYGSGRFPCLAIGSSAQGHRQPFSQALANYLKCRPQQIEQKLEGKTFAVNVGDAYFIRSVAKVNEDSLTFFCDLEFCAAWRVRRKNRPVPRATRSMKPRKPPHG